ncbi:MAG: N-acetyltransferase [Chromatiales bacterium]|nr:N-acetyltransferase [Chromatiales bacterium]
MAPDGAGWRIEVCSGLAAVPAADWNAVAGTAWPFLRHEFLLALEESGSACAASGWQPCHLLLREAGALVGAVPLYLKSNSFGEFVFDWAWADAYRRAGLRYFPKLVAGVPFTPATSPRFLHAPGADPVRVRRALVGAAMELARESGASSLHVLFPPEDEVAALEGEGLLRRKDCQFHWHNQGYATFDDFLGTFTAEKRKKAKRERRRVAEAGIRFRHLTGRDIDAGLLARIMPLYASSFWRRGREPYLNEDFFRRLCATLPDSLLVILALQGDEPVATAICYRGADALYGRYWGSSADYHSLHFETCYYQGIEYCIEQGISLFEPGTQGEHKISRGFVPTATWSAHWLSHPQFFAAIDQYLDRERAHIDRYIAEVNEHVPYRRSDD